MTRKIVVIGGGVIGASVAWHLAERGLGAVTLVERDRLGAGSTWHSAGNITWKPVHNGDAPVLYMFETIARLERETGLTTGWLETGRLFVARGEAALAGFADQAREAESRGHPSRLLEPVEAAKLHPLLDPNALAGAWFNGLSGRLNPADLVAAYARAARGAGATIREGTTVTAISATGGRINGIETDAGFVEADAVVVCAGVWSRALLVALDQPVAQWGCRHFYVIADVAPRLARETPSFVCPEDLIYGREETGGFLFGCFDADAKTIDVTELPEPFAFALLDPEWDKFAPYFEKAAEIFPALADAPIRSFVAGPETFTPDGHPLIGPLAGMDGLYVCSALNSTGVTLSAAAGRTIADMIDGKEPAFDAAPWAPGRFGAQAADEDWLRAKASASPSLGYRQSNM